MRVMTVVLPRKSDPVMMEVINKNRLGEKVTVNENGMISQTMDAALPQGHASRTGPVCLNRCTRSGLQMGAVRAVGKKR